MTPDPAASSGLDRPATGESPIRSDADPVVHQDAQSGFREDLVTMKMEIDALQIQMATKGAPWYKQMAVIVSIAALLLSLISTYYAERNASEQAMQSKRNDLRQVVIQFGDQAVLASELPSKYGENLASYNIALSNISTQQRILMGQEIELIEEMGDRVTAAEFAAAASHLSAMADTRAPRYFELAVAKADTARTKTEILRGLAGFYFVSQAPDEGEEVFERIELLRESNAEPRLWKVSEQAFSELQWSSLELTANRCDKAAMHNAKSAQLYAELESLGWNVAPVSAQRKKLDEDLKRRC